MTRSEISGHADRLKNDLAQLMKVQVGMGNYKDVMRRYQVILNDTIVLVRELANLPDDDALDPPAKPLT